MREDTKTKTYNALFASPHDRSIETLDGWLNAIRRLPLIPKRIRLIEHYMKVKSGETDKGDTP